MSDQLASLVQDLGGQILTGLKNDLGNTWNELSHEDLDKFEFCAKRMAELSLKKLAGQDVAEDIAWIEFRLASLTHLKANKVKAAFWATTEKVISVATSGLLGAIKLAV